MNETPQFLEQVHRLDGQALAALHDRYYPQVYRYARYRLDDEQAAEDAAGETFLRLLDALHKPGSQIKDLRAWLLGTVFHLIQDQYRERYRKPQENLEDQELLQGGTAVDSEVEQRGDQQAVREAIRQLTPEQQHVLALRFSQELSLEETAAVMGKTINAVKVLQFRAVQALRQRMTRVNEHE